MGLLEFGTSFGLAATFDHNAHAAHQLELLKMERALRLDQENRVKLQADEFKMPEQMNEYDSPRAQQIAEQKFKEASAYELSNPDYAINVTKKRIRDKILYDAVNNQYTYRGMRFKDAEKKMTDFLANNPGAIRNPEIQKQLDEIKAYKTHQGPGDPSEYVFRSPDDETKMFAAMQSAAGKAAVNGIEDYRDGLGSARQFVTDANKDEATEAFIQSPDADSWKRKYNSDPEKGTINFHDWMKKKLNPYFPRDIITPGKFLKGMTDANGNVIGGVPGQGLIPYHEMLQKAIAQPNTDILAPVEAIDKLYRNNNGTYDMSKSYLLHQQTGDIKKVDRVPVNLTTTKNAVSTGIVRFIPDASNPSGGVYMTKFIVTVPIKTANKVARESLNDAHPDVWDETPHIGHPSIDSDYDGYGFNISADEKGNDAISMEVWKPLDPSNQAMANTFNAALGGTKSEAVSSAPQQQQQQAQAMAIGTQYTVPGTGEVLTLQADGNWLTSDGKIYGQ